MTANPITHLPVRPLDGVTIAAPMVRLLGTLDAPGRSLPNAPKRRQTLALMLLHADRFVSGVQFIDELWTDPPRSADQLVQTYVMFLRHAHVAWDIVTMSGGYRLRLAPALTDVRVFDDLVDAGRRALDGGDLAVADRLLREALALWRGDPLVDVGHGAVVAPLVAGLADRYRTARGWRFEVDLRLGRHRQIVDELAAEVRADPVREDLTANLMLALYRSNRRVDALAAYRGLRAALLEEHGLEPCADLRRLQQQILTGDPLLDLQGGAA